MRAKLTPEIEEKILDLHYKFYSWNDIKKELGVGYSWILRVKTKHGLICGPTSLKRQ